MGNSSNLSSEVKSVNLPYGKLGKRSKTFSMPFKKKKQKIKQPGENDSGLDVVASWPGPHESTHSH